MFYPSLISLAFLQLVAVNASCLRSNAYNAITAFGDSLTDNGVYIWIVVKLVLLLNKLLAGRSFAASHGNDPSDPAYYKGRYSNGPVWIEYLADELDVKLTDLAFAGGMSLHHSFVYQHSIAISYFQQFESFRCIRPNHWPSCPFRLGSTQPLPRRFDLLVAEAR